MAVRQNITGDSVLTCNVLQKSNSNNSKRLISWLDVLNQFLLYIILCMSWINSLKLMIMLVKFGVLMGPDTGFLKSNQDLL